MPFEFNSPFVAIADSIKRVQEHFKLLQETLIRSGQLFPVHLKLFAKHGWYISGNFAISDTINLGNQLEKGYIRKVDRELKLFYTNELNFIIRSLIQDYPNKSKVLREAVKAHRLKMYYSSTSLFLSLADGLCNGFLYRNRNNKHELRKELTSINKHALAEFLAVLTEVSAIDANHKDKNKYPSNLNRHGVFHGFDNDFGTQINSLKALSLLAFIGDFFQNDNRFIKN